MNRELDFIFTKFRLGLLENREYKINLIMVFLFDTMVISAMVVLYLLVESVINISGWSVFDFLTLTLTMLLNAKIIFGTTFRFFNQFLLSGNFNLWLTKPVSPFSFMITKNMNGANLASFLFFLFPLVFIISLFQENILFGWLIFIIGNIFHLLLSWCIELTSFFIKENSFIREPINRTNWFLEDYIPTIYQKAFFFNFIALAPSVVYGFLTISVMKGDFTYLYLIKPTLNGIPILAILCIILYKNGLKKYEAFS